MAGWLDAMGAVGGAIALIDRLSENPKMRANNPRGRSKRPVTRISQATGKHPTKRLVKRRLATAKAPRGFFANPSLPVYFGVKINAGNDANGNPRRAVIFLRHNGRNASVHMVVREDYAGMSDVFERAGLESATTPVVGEFRVTPGEFRDVLKIKPYMVY